MDFAWVVDALRRGLKVTRKSWAGNGTQFLYKESGSSITKQRGPYVFNWEPTGEELLYATDWEEYVEPKKEPAYNTELPFVMTEQDSYGGKPVEEQELDEETKQAIEQIAKITAEGIAAIFREDSIRRIIQKKCQKQAMEPDHV